MSTYFEKNHNTLTVKRPFFLTTSLQPWVTFSISLFNFRKLICRHCCDFYLLWGLFSLTCHDDCQLFKFSKDEKQKCKRQRRRLGHLLNLNNIGLQKWKILSCRNEVNIYTTLSILNLFDSILIQSHVSIAKLTRTMIPIPSRGDRRYFSISDALASLALMIVTGSLTDRNWSQSVWSHWLVWSSWSFRSVQSPWSVLSLVSLVTLVILVTLAGLVTPVNMHDFAYCIIYTLHDINFYLAHLWTDFQSCSLRNRFCNSIIKYIVIFSIGASWCGFAGISPLASESLLDITRIDHHFGILATVPKKPHNQLKSHHLKTSFQIIRDLSKKTLTVIF